MLDRLRIRVERVVGGGRRLAAPCPNPEHADKHASWFIRNNPGEAYHSAHACQGCGFRGGPLLLVRTLLGISEEDARAWLQDLAAPPPLPTKVEVEVREPAGFDHFKLPPCFVYAPIADWPEEHRKYVLGRVEPWQVERWGIGYVTKCACDKRRHRSRIAVTVRDSKGKACAYTCRAIDPKTSLRHVEPHTKEHPKRCMFGSQHWDGCTAIVVVEGAFDALAVEAVLFKLGLLGRVAVGALRGSSPHPTTLTRLAAFEHIVVMTDPDRAGKKALAAIRASCSRHSKLTVLTLPPKLDPSAVGHEWLDARLRRVLAA